MHQDESADHHLVGSLSSNFTPSISSPTSSSGPSKTPDFLKVLTTPFTELIIQLDKKVLKGWATNDEKYVNATTIMQLGCHSPTNSSEARGGCDYLLAYLGPEGANLGEAVLGVILLLLSLVMLCTCLIGNRPCQLISTVG
jgi:hypothetical protein